MSQFMLIPMNTSQGSYYAGQKRRGSLASLYSVGTSQRTRGGLSYSQTMIQTKRKRRIGRLGKSFKARVKSVAPAKHRSGSTAVTINSNLIYTCSLTTQISQGPSNNQRIGDYAHLEALKLNGFIQSSTESNAYKFRVLVGYSGEEYTSSTLTTPQLTDEQVFFVDTALTVVNGIINPKAFTVLHDEIIDMNSQVEGDRTIQSFRTTVPLNESFYYQSNGSIYGKLKNLYMIVIGYGADKITGDAVGSAVISYDLIFKD